MKRTTLLLTLVAALMLSAFAMAQGVYTGTRFSANFNGPVTTKTYSNSTNSNIEYDSNDGNVYEAVAVRTVDHDIAVNFTNTEFYRDHLTGAFSSDQQASLDTKVNADGYYQGHPYSFGAVTYFAGGIWWHRYERVFIVDSRTAIFILITIPINEDTDVTAVNNGTTGTVNTRWQQFENSLNIR
jgi:hypothetical protein